MVSVNRFGAPGLITQGAGRLADRLIQGTNLANQQRSRAIGAAANLVGGIVDERQQRADTLNQLIGQFGTEGIDELQEPVMADAGAARVQLTELSQLLDSEIQGLEDIDNPTDQQINSLNALIGEKGIIDQQLSNVPSEGEFDTGETRIRSLRDLTDPRSFNRALGQFKAKAEQQRLDQETQVLVRKIDAEQRAKAAQTQAKTLRDIEQQEFKNTQGLRKEADSFFKDFRSIKGSVGAAVESFMNADGDLDISNANSTRVKDDGLIFAWLKVLDPGSTVREGEKLDATKTNLSGSFIQIYNRLLGDAKLAESQRRDILTEMIKQAKGRQRTAQNDAARFKEIAIDSGLDAEAVIDPSILDNSLFQFKFVRNNGDGVEFSSSASEVFGGQ